MFLLLYGSDSKRWCEWQANDYLCVVLGYTLELCFTASGSMRCLIFLQMTASLQAP